jgi:hypothetical protein
VKNYRKRVTGRLQTSKKVSKKERSNEGRGIRLPLRRGFIYGTVQCRRQILRTESTAGEGITKNNPGALVYVV